jgi:hypothetical protein
MSAASAALAGPYQAHASELHGFARRRAGRQEAENDPRRNRRTARRVGAHHRPLHGQDIASARAFWTRI